MGRSIMVVGNGDIPEGVAGTVDAGDLVFRFNECRSFGPGGSRTDVVAICSTGRPARRMIASPLWRDSRAVQEASAIWSVRDPQKFAELRTVLALSHPELEDFCDDLSQDFEAFATERGKAHYVVPRAMHEAADSALLDHDPDPYVVPSSGLIVITELLNNPAYAADSISIAGFSHEGWDGHPFSAERRLVEAYVAAGRLTRLHPLTAPLQGA